jgi:hypothetical protein
LEQWLRELGAVQRSTNSCLWVLTRSGWTAEIELDIEELSVRWQASPASVGPATVERHFPYGFSRADVEAAILAGP